MAPLRWLLPIVLIMGSKFVHSNNLGRYGRENIVDLCDSSFTNKNKVQCYCKNTIIESRPFVFKAECTIEENNIPIHDDIWRSFSSINTIERLSISSKGKGLLTYIPTSSLKMLRDLLKLNIQHGKIENVHAFAFANLTNIEEIKLSGNGIKTLSVNAFAHHPNVTSITLDNNYIEEIKRHVFRRLPQLEQLFLTENNISVIHDRAFVHLSDLRTLELDHNQIFVLTNETFSGLVNLTKLELSYNNLEVIGDNTFAALENVRYVNLANNRIKMLDDKAFQGAKRLESLSLANNKLKELSNEIIFSGLPSLVALDLKANGMTTLPLKTVALILPNFYGPGSSISFEDNKLTCDCKLNWFRTLKNRTQNKRLQETIDNLMCYPSAQLAEDFKKYEESERVHAEDRRTEDGLSTNTEYEYYDDTSLDGKLFFNDIPEHMLPCDENEHTIPTVSSLPSSAKPAGSATPVIHLKPVTNPSFESPQTRKPQYPHLSQTTPYSYLHTANRRTEAPLIYSPSVFQDENTEVPISTLSREFTAPSETTTVTSRLSTNYHQNIFRAQNTMRKEATTVRPVHFTTKRYTPFPIELTPTEDMVSDGESNEEKTTIHDKMDKKTDSVLSTKITQNVENEKISRNTVDKDLATTEIITVNDRKTAPESLSHVHASSASNLSSKIVPFVIPMCVLYVGLKL